MIKVVLSQPKKFHLISWLIMKATGFPASHASVHVEGSGTLKGRTLVLEAVTHGVRVIPGGWWHATNNVVRCYQLTSEFNEAGGEAYRHVWDEANVPYDFMGIFKFGLRLLARWILGVRIKHSPDTPDRMFCSELVARWLMQLSKSIHEEHRHVSISPEMMSPGDLVPVLERMGCFQVAAENNVGLK